VHKYPLKYQESQMVATYSGARPLHAGVDPNGMACVWMLTDTAQPRCEYEIFIRGTGYELPNKPAMRHVSTFLVGQLVWHVFMEW
jgi:hypothetical protein